MSKNNLNLNIGAIEEIYSGYDLPSQDFPIDSVNIFMFSAVTWNRHRIHYDHEQAVREGHKGIVAQRGLLGNFLCQYLNSIFSGAFIEQVDWKVLKSAGPGDTLTCCGKTLEVVPGEDSDAAIIDLELVNQSGELVTSGQARVRAIKETDRIKPIRKPF
ncbi:hypothetical protein MD273_07070 [Marinobacter pelagius]|uniref:hypothetical protein n=1 Tax=Marinobacter sp. C7 TaxID=2951363 RepID=UPI001EF0EE73|nr:hypothetical protein [Marinobacter sp. C7]MCG7199481.1 hypothetical protein [Marinobacter sp. C7]